MQSSILSRLLRLLFLLLFLISTGGTYSVAVGQTPPPGRQELIQELLTASRGQVSTAIDRFTGQVRFLSLPEEEISLGNALDENDGSREFHPQAYLNRYGALFGFQDARGQMRLLKSDPTPQGTYARFFQELQGIPVLGGEIIVQTGTRGNLRMMTGRVMSGQIPSLDPGLPEAKAILHAMTATAHKHNIAESDMQVENVRLAVYDPHLLDSHDQRAPALVWEVILSGQASRLVNERVLVDAQTGQIQLSIDQVYTARDREVYDWHNDPSGSQIELIRTETGAPSSLLDAENAYQFSGDTYNFFRSRYNRDSIDGLGMTIVSNVRYCSYDDLCPYENAYWYDNQMYYGESFASADDVVAHELTHGITENESNLFYYMQSGAINESLSDVWGEFVDLTNTSGDDSASVRWKVGEDLPGTSYLRNMADPGDTGVEGGWPSPDRMTSPNYYCTIADNGGVHYNSGVLNKAVYLMTEGGNFNRQAINGLGIERSSAILYELQTHLLTSGAEYSDLFHLLPQACANLVGTYGIGSRDCAEVQKAVRATEMDREPACPSPSLSVSCPSGVSPKMLYEDSFEVNPDPGWEEETTIGGSRWGQYTGYAPEGIYALWASDATLPGASADRVRGDTSWTAVNALSLQEPINSSVYFLFSHQYDLNNSSANSDGGVVEYSLDNGNTWLSLDDFPAENGPLEIVSALTQNPLAGRAAFSGISYGILDTRYDLSALNKKAVKFRFRLGTDTAANMDASGNTGWTIDHLRIYSCPAPLPPKAYKILLPVLMR